MQEEHNGASQSLKSTVSTLTVPPHSQTTSPVTPFNAMGVGGFVSCLKASLKGMQLQEQPVSTTEEKQPSIKLILFCNSLIECPFKTLSCGTCAGPSLPVSMAPWKAL